MQNTIAMKNKTNINTKASNAWKAVKEAAASERGSMMMEYVMVLCGIGAALAVFMNREFYSAGGGFGSIGEGVVAFYQRALGGLSLPIP